MYNPIRRNKNIGKTQGGRVKDGEASEKWSRIFSQNTWEQLSESDEFQIIRENPSRDYFHPCGKDDYFNLIERLPEDLTKYLKCIVLRRLPNLDKKWGVEARMRYSCVIINSFPKNMRMYWNRKPAKVSISHYAPWCETWKQDGSNWYLEWTKDEIKRYYLYHLFLHELGHINQPWFHSKVKREDFAEDFALQWAKEFGEM
jgi:hypothetical protein